MLINKLNDPPEYEGQSATNIITYLRQYLGKKHAMAWHGSFLKARQNKQLSES